MDPRKLRQNLRRPKGTVASLLVDDGPKARGSVAAVLDGDENDTPPFDSVAVAKATQKLHPPCSQGLAPKAPPLRKPTPPKTPPRWKYCKWCGIEICPTTNLEKWHGSICEHRPSVSEQTPTPVPTEPKEAMPRMERRKRRRRRRASATQKQKPRKCRPRQLDKPPTSSHRTLAEQGAAQLPDEQLAIGGTKWARRGAAQRPDEQPAIGATKRAGRGAPQQPVEPPTRMHYKQHIRRLLLRQGRLIRMTG